MGEMEGKKGKTYITSTVFNICVHVLKLLKIYRFAERKGKNPPRRIFTFLLYFALDFVPMAKSRAPLYTLPTLPQAGGLLHRRCRCFLSARFLCSYIDFLDIL